MKMTLGLHTDRMPGAFRYFKWADSEARGSANVWRPGLSRMRLSPAAALEIDERLGTFALHRLKPGLHTTWATIFACWLVFLCLLVSVPGSAFAQNAASADTLERLAKEAHARF